MSSRVPELSPPKIPLSRLFVSIICPSLVVLLVELVPLRPLPVGRLRVLRGMRIAFLGVLALVVGVGPLGRVGVADWVVEYVMGLAVLGDVARVLAGRLREAGRDLVAVGSVVHASPATPRVNERNARLCLMAPWQPKGTEAWLGCRAMDT